MGALVEDGRGGVRMVAEAYVWLRRHAVVMGHAHEESCEAPTS